MSTALLPSLPKPKVPSCCPSTHPLTPVHAERSDLFALLLSGVPASLIFHKDGNNPFCGIDWMVRIALFSPQSYSNQTSATSYGCVAATGVVPSPNFSGYGGIISQDAAIAICAELQPSLNPKYIAAKYVNDRERRISLSSVGERRGSLGEDSLNPFSKQMSDEEFAAYYTAIATRRELYLFMRQYVVNVLFICAHHAFETMLVYCCLQ